MKKNEKNTPVVRIALLCCFAALFVVIAAIFFYQYRQYRVLENRLIKAYNIRETDAENLNDLFSTFSDVENTFRLYTLDFDSVTYSSYLAKLHNLKGLVDTMIASPAGDFALNHPAVKIGDRQKVSQEFATLKRRLDSLVLHASDSLSVLKHGPAPVRYTYAGPTIRQATVDTAKTVITDTIVRKKPGLLKRIFSAKDDTIIIAKEQQQLDVEKVAIVKQRVDAGHRLNADNTGHIRNAFLQLKGKERQLINVNFELLDDLKRSVEAIKALDVDLLRRAEQTDFTRYRRNVDVFGKQLISALVLMFIMIVALVYYQIYATSYERRLRQEKDYAANLAEEKTSVLAGISHEIRTPLNSLLGIVDLFKSRSKSTNVDEKLVDSVYYSINVVSNTITDILNLSKLEASNKGDISLEYFSPRKSFEDVVALHKNQAELKNLRLRTEIEIDGRLTLLSNEFRIKQVASNFLSNAIKYTQKGEIIFRSSVSVTKDTSYLHVEVEDTGMGIREQDKEQVFRKYFTAAPNSGGIGLGLYITKIMVEELGGHVGLKSRPGKGSIFFATIPFSGSKMEDREQREARLADLPPDLRLLVVDDNPINILFMKQFFKGFGNTHVANEGTAALSILENHPVDLVITDINMPGMSGVQLLERIRADVRFKKVKVLAISADTSTLRYAEEQTADASFDGFIEKPFTETTLVKTILEAIARENGYKSSYSQLSVG